MICTRLNIAQVMGVISKFMANLGGEHLSAIKRILRYIKETLGVALCFRVSKLIVKDYIDSHFVDGLDKRKYIIGYMFTLV